VLNVEDRTPISDESPHIDISWVTRVQFCGAMRKSMAAISMASNVLCVMFSSKLIEWVGCGNKKPPDWVGRFFCFAWMGFGFC
jgi:hypothetical protein